MRLRPWLLLVAPLLALAIAPAPVRGGDLVQLNLSAATAGADLAAVTPDVGAQFARVPGLANAIVATASGRMRAGATNADCRYYSPTAPGSANYSVRLNATYASVTGGDVVGPTIRCAGSADTEYSLIWAKLDGAGIAGLALYKHVAGQPTQIGTTLATLNGTSVIPTAGASALLQISVSGTTLTGYYNGVAALTATDSAIAGAGSGGVYLRSGSAADGAGPQVSELYVNSSPAYVPTTAGPASGSGTNGSPTPAPGRADTFNRADSATSLLTPSDGGSAYDAINGTWGTSGNAAYCPNAVGSSPSFAVLESSQPDVTVQATLTAQSQAIGLAIGVSDDRSEAIYLSCGYGETALNLIHSGAVTYVGGGPVAQPGDVLQLIRSGGQVTAKRNGAVIFGPVATQAGAGLTRHGLMANLDSTGRLDNLSITPVAAPPPVVPSPHATAGDAASVTLQCATPTGGQSPLSYQWHRSDAPAFTAGPSTALAGKTALTLTDSTSAVHYYRLVATDALGQIAASPELLAGPWDAPIVLGVIGDSISAGVGATSGNGAVDVLAARLAAKGKQRVVTVVNKAQPGSTTGTWLATFLTPALVDLAAANASVVHICLGTNDCGTLSSADYGTNLAAILSAVRTALPNAIVVIHHSPGFNAALASYGRDEAAAGRLRSYLTAIQPLCDGVHVFLGDTSANLYFADHTTLLGDGTHPNDAGAAILGAFWLDAVAAALAPPSTGGGGSGTGPTLSQIHDDTAAQLATLRATLLGATYSANVTKFGGVDGSVAAFLADYDPDASAAALDDLKARIAVAAVAAMAADSGVVGDALAALTGSYSYTAHAGSVTIIDRAGHQRFSYPAAGRTSVTPLPSGGQ